MSSRVPGTSGTWLRAGPASSASGAVLSQMRGLIADIESMVAGVRLLLGQLASLVAPTRPSVDGDSDAGIEALARWESDMATYESQLRLLTARINRLSKRLAEAIAVLGHLASSLPRAQRRDAAEIDRMQKQAREAAEVVASSLSGVEGKDCGNGSSLTIRREQGTTRSRDGSLLSFPVRILALGVGVRRSGRSTRSPTPTASGLPV